MIDREEVERRMRLALTESRREPYNMYERATLAALDLLREFGHVAGCRCIGEHERLEGKGGKVVHVKVASWSDPRCFQQSPAKETTSSTAWHCAKCNKPMQFFDGICFSCNGGKDPGD